MKFLICTPLPCLELSKKHVGNWLITKFYVSLHSRYEIFHGFITNYYKLEMRSHETPTVKRPVLLRKTITFAILLFFSHLSSSGFHGYLFPHTSLPFSSPFLDWLVLPNTMGLKFQFRAQFLVQFPFQSLAQFPAWLSCQTQFSAWLCYF